MEERPIEVQCHAPRGIISVPISTSHNLACRAEHCLADSRCNGCPDLGARTRQQRGAFERGNQPTLEFRTNRIAWKFISIFVGSTNTEVWQVVLVAIDADKIFQTESHS